MKTKICKCGRECKQYANAFHKLCTTCNQQRLIEKNQTQKQHTIQHIKNKYHIIEGRGRNTGRTFEHKKQTGEREVFLAIWAIRPHICTNCWDKLGDEPLAHFFSHIKPKSTHPHLRLVPSNIQLLCFDCHYAHDFIGKEAFLKRKYKNN